MNERLKEIEQRLSQIAEEMKSPEANLENLEEEVEQLIAERKQIEEGIQKRNTIRTKIADGMVGLGVSVIPKGEERTYDVSSAEYRSAWLKNIRGMQISDIERRALTSAAGSAGAAIPTATANRIIEKVHQYAPLLDKITLLEVAGNVAVPAEGTTTDAAKHTEGSTITASADTLTKVILGGYEVTKLITISKTVETMSIDAFEKWLIEKISRNVADKISDLIINGTGSGEAEGISAITWNANNSVTVAKESKPTEENILTLVGFLNGGYDVGAEWLMSKKTFFAEYYPLMNKAKNITVTHENGNYYIQGYPVTMDDRVKTSEAYLGNIYRGYIGNMAEKVNVTSQFVTRENAYDFLGAALFDGKVQAVEAFVKMVKSAT